MDTNIVRNRLSNLIEESLLKAIQDGEFPPGSKLPSERKLMEMFDVGRPSVKEALLMLDRKGLVKLRRGVAPEVTLPTPKAIFESISDMVTNLVAHEEHREYFFELRIMIESYSACERAKTYSDAFAEALRAALKNCRDAAGDAESFRLADLDFHKTIIEYGANPVLNALHGGLIEWGMYPAHDSGPIGKIHERVIAQHDAIVRAIESGDADAVHDAVCEHLRTRPDQHGE